MIVPGIENRFLLARPRAGLNDTLCQIELCLRHAETFGRTLVLDLSGSQGLSGFGRFFQWKSPMAHVQVDLSPDRIAMLNALQCRPAEVTGRLTTYRNGKARLPDGRVANCLEGTAVPLSSDLGRDYPEPVLLHDTWGGGDESRDFLRRVTLEPGLASAVAESIASLGPGYAAIHIRHTDFRTEDWRSFLRSIRGDLRRRTVLICSDNAAVIAGAREILRPADVRTVAEIPSRAGLPLHLLTDAEQATAIRIHRIAMIDLLSLAAATDLYLTGNAQLRMSGFSRLAGALCEDRTLLASLLGEAASAIGVVPGRVHQVVLWRTRALAFPRRVRRRLMRLGWTAAKALGLR